MILLILKSIRMHPAFEKKNSIINYFVVAFFLCGLQLAITSYEACSESKDTRTIMTTGNFSFQKLAPLPSIDVSYWQNEMFSESVARELWSWTSIVSHRTLPQISMKIFWSVKWEVLLNMLLGILSSKTCVCIWARFYEFLKRHEMESKIFEKEWPMFT